MSESCPCTEDTSTSEEILTPHCECPRDEHEIVTHEETCLLYKNEKIIYEPDPCCTDPEGICTCCRCLVDQCRCNLAGREAFDEWRKNRDVGPMPAVLETTHPLMQRFQETLRKFLEKENAIAESEILNLKDELRLSKQAYDKDLEDIYRSDHDTNAQRMLIEEYEKTLAQKTEERLAAEQQAKDANHMYKKAKAKLEQDIIDEREATEELEALTTLCRQLEQWRDETESDLTVSHRMSDKMRAEKKALADEKRQLDMIILGLSNEVWKLESKLEMFKKQLDIKNVEMEKVNDKVTAYAAELEDLELDKRRLVSLWNSVLVNIQQRDRVYDSVRDDYKSLQENYCTLLNNFEVTKKVLTEEMNKGKELAMNKDKLLYDINTLNKLLEKEELRRANMDSEIAQISESIEMTERDQELIKSENQAMYNILKSTEKDLDRKTDQKLKLENEILENLKECLLNDKAVESMANGIKKMREMSRKQELSLVTMENQHAKIMFEIEVQRSRQAQNTIILEKSLAKVKEKEKELDKLQEKYDEKALVVIRTQRDLDIITKKYMTLKEIFDMKSPQERRIEEAEQTVRNLRTRTEQLQHEWLRLQGHVVKLTTHHHRTLTDINLISKQIQICEQKTMRVQAEIETVMQERNKVERTLRNLRGQLEVLERTRKDALDRNNSSQRATVAITHEYSANLKGAEAEIFQIEDDIEALDKEKIALTQDLDKMHREALIWQRKGILAVELKRSMQEAKSSVGEIGKMKNEIHRMEIRREQLIRTGEKLAEDLALCVNRRETAMDKARATAALEKAHGPAGNTSQFTYHHKLRLAKSDLARVTKDLADAKAHMESLQKEQERLEKEIAEKKNENKTMEEEIATILSECRQANIEKQWLLERVVRSQRLGKELTVAVKRQSLKLRKAKPQIMTEYEQAKTLNSRLRHIVDVLAKEYPHLSDKFETMANTLNIHSPSNSPRLTPDCMGAVDKEGECSVDRAEKPFFP